jgi:hypothetical protein
VAAVNVLVYSVLGAAVYAALGLAVCLAAISRLYNNVEYVTISAGCAGAVVGAVAGATQLLTAAMRAKPNPPAAGERPS